MILGTSAFSQEMNNWYFCFRKETSLQEVQAYLSPYLLLKDKIYENTDDNCLQINLSDYRKELFEKQLRRNFFIKDIYKETNSKITVDSPGAMGQCSLEFTIKGKSANQSSETSAHVDNDAVLTASKKETNNVVISNSQILVLSGKSASIQWEGKNIFVTCITKGQNQAELSFALNDSKIKNSKSISSSVNIYEGQELNVGSVLADINGTDSKISTDVGIDIVKSQENQNLSYFIILKKIIWN